MYRINRRESLLNAVGVRKVFFGLIEGSGPELLLDLTSRGFDSACLGQDLRFCISNMLPGDADAADLQATLELGG